MKILISFSFFLIFAVQISDAQNIKKCMQMLENKEYDHAIDGLQKLISAKKNMLEAKWALTLIYTDSTTRYYNANKAITNLKYVERNFVKLDDGEKEDMLNDYKLSHKNILSKKSTLSVNAFAIAHKTNTIAAYESFAQEYENTSYANRAIEIRDSLAYSDALKVNSFKSYEYFISNFPKAKQISEARQKYESMYMALYQLYSLDGELISLQEFQRDYPDFPFMNTVFARDYELANWAVGLNFGVGVTDYNRASYNSYIISSASKDLAFVALQRILESSIQTKNWKAALDTLETYAKYFPATNANLLNLRQLLTSKTTEVRAVSIGDSINSNADEYSPVMSADGKTLYFCGVNRSDNLGLEDIFVSKNEVNIWRTPQILDGLCDMYKNEAPLAVSADGNQLLLFADGDIFLSERKLKGWSKARSFWEINSPNWEADAQFTSNGGAVIFASNSPNNVGGYHEFYKPYHGAFTGNIDIYVCVKTESGWSDPINLGKTINTPYCERSAFLHPDMKTLYFSSDGHGGMGRLDIFKCTRLSDTSWTQWSEPVNLGKEINTVQDDWNFKVTTDGKFGYYAVSKGTNYDINIAPLPEENRPNNVVTISGKITSATTKNPLEATIKWENLSTGEIMGVLKSNPSDGSYFIVLPYGKDYGYFVEKEGFYPSSGHFDLRNEVPKNNYQKDIELTNIKELINKGLSIPLANIFFDSEKFELKPSSYPELNRLADFLKKNPALKIEISGHTDNSGKADKNLTLSQNRANSVKSYLLKLGCSDNLLIAKGYGQNKPIAENTNDDNKAKNRRVEFKVLK